MATVDYKKIGLKVGLEIHQQLDSKEKLFCGCQTKLFKEEPEITFMRRLRPTQSELGQIDPAAFFEFKKGVQIIYEANKETSCLVEMDEEPPHELNQEALDTALIISLLLKAKPLDEIHVMRKTVIDGSNTTGFQRTCVVASNGKIETNEKIVPIQHIGLEEDACRKIDEKGKILRYRIDRLSIPLIEIATAPVIYTPTEAEEVALVIGRILRATNRVKRGLGTIRQDLNISINDGALMEIKGVQELDLVSLVISKEVERQLNLLEIRERLVGQGIKKKDIQDKFVDITKVFSNTKCKIIRDTIDKGCRVLAVKLPKFQGFLKKELIPDVRLGTEMADRARFWGHVGGLFHTDELPAYGINTEEVDMLKQYLNAKPNDAVVFVSDFMENASDALRAVTTRAREVLTGIPQETRASKPDGSTRYMRPRPGAARMYPETDVPPIQVTEDYIENLLRCLPELPEKKKQRLMRDHGLNEKLAKQILDSEFIQVFEKVVGGPKISPTFVVVTLTETLKALRRDGVEVDKISNEQFSDLFSLVGRGEVAKEAAPNIIIWLSEHPESKVADAVKTLNISMISQSALEKIIDDLIVENQKLLAEHGRKAFGALMGLVMKKVRGKARAEFVSEIVKKKIKDLD